MSWLLDEPADRVRLLGLRPELAAAHEQVMAAVWSSGVPAALLERCRLRMAELLDARTALAERTSGVDLDGAPADDPATRAALTFTELFVVDHHGITDEQAAAVRDALGEPGFVALTTALAVWENQHRFDIALGSI